MRKILYISNYSNGVGGIDTQVDLLRVCVNHEDWILDNGHWAFDADIFSTKGTAVKRVWKFIELIYMARRYDVLHMHGCSGWGMLPVVYGVIVGKIWRKRIIVTYHGGEAAAYLAKHGAFARRWLKSADKVIVLSGFLKKVFDEHEIPCVVIPNIVQLREDVYQSKKRIAPKMVSVRHLTDLYRIDLIIRAFEKVVEKYPEATLDILGQGDKRDELERLVVSGLGVSGLASRVRFIGQVENEKIYEYLKANDIMLSAPKTDNMPVSLMEAMNAGVLVISSNVGGVPYMIEHRKTGLLFDGRADALAEQILWALEHQKESVAMIKAAHEEVRKYSWERVKQQLLPLYSEK